MVANCRASVRHRQLVHSRTMLLLLLSLLLVVVSSTKLPAASATGRTPWSQTQRLEANQPVEVTLALKQRNMQSIRDRVAQVSNPRSEMYGQYWSIQQIAQVVAPTSESIKIVHSWANKIGAHDIQLTRSKDFLIFQINTEKLEAALDIKMHRFEHQASGRVVFRTLDPVILPAEVAPHVELVVGLTDFFDYNHERKQLKEMTVNKRFKTSAPNSAPEIMRGARGSESEVTATVKIYCQNGQPASTFPACSDVVSNAAILVFQTMYGTKTHSQTSIPIDATHCSLSSGNVLCNVHAELLPYERVNLTARTHFSDGTASAWSYYGTVFSPSTWVTPQLVNKMYQIPQGYRASHPNNSQSVVAFEGQYISLADLQQFWTYSGMKQDKPTIVGPNDPTNPGGESTLDIQWVMGIGAGVPTTFWSVGGSGPTHGNGAYVLTWALQIANTTNPPWVTSISYGDTEQGFFEKFGNYDYINRMNDELAKMALRGLTVLAGSGDAGASNVGEDGNDISDTDPTCTPMRPFFPSNSPYVMSISSTFISKNAIPFCQQTFEEEPIVCSQLGEVAVSVRQGTHWTTGGGFSNLTGTLPWQKTAVQNFLSLSQGGPLPPSQYWNSTGRGYPDVSTVGFNLYVVWGGKIVSIGGTSASGPIMAGIVSLLNDIRLWNGKPTLGLVTPFFYELQASNGIYFNDIVVGENLDGDLQDRGSPYPTYCLYGFSTQVGWDAVTGLGTPVFQYLADAVDQMPF